MLRSLGELNCPKKPLNVEPYPDSVTKEYEIQVITPLFGGGVEAGENDPITLVRPSSIRGHLRFWWRVTRGARCKSIPELLQRESEIWGSVNNPSSVVIEVNKINTKETSRRSPPDYGFSDRLGPELYALFSAKKEICSEGFSFVLTIRWLQHKKLQQMRDGENKELENSNAWPKAKFIDDIGPDVKEALQAWVNFGGIGGRTRRGCGALFCKQLAIDSIAEFNRYPFNILYKSSFSDPLRAWSESVRVIKNFRQSFRGLKHDKIIPTRRGSKTIRVFGRSYWPEPDSIRKITGCSLKKPNKNNFDHSIPQTPTDFFPRAELGLPIIFHFADGPGKNSALSNIDPPDVTLIPVTSNGKDGTRMASPAITRPLRLATGEDIAVIIVLNSKPLPPLKLVGDGPNLPHDIAQNKIANSALASYPRSPMGPSAVTGEIHSKKGSALEAFINYAKDDEQFKEVLR
ncbi:RAMP superfamily protein [uncultured archaeon]|nr:RAMP superfamily protein [uncultured archaeon]